MILSDVHLKLNNTLISIIVPIYNVEKYLKECLDSIKSQTYNNIEIIMVDDGSVDNSSMIAKEYALNDDRFKYYYQNNQGLGSARNCGVMHANGEYIAFVDSDDLISKTYIEDLYSLMVKHNLDLAFCSYKKFLNTIDNSFLECSVEQNKILIFDRLQIWENYFFASKNASVRNNLISACTKLYKTKTIKKIKFNNKTFEDQYYINFVIDECEKVGFINKGLYFYRLNRQGSICNKLNKQSELNFALQYINDRIIFFKEKHYPKKWIRKILKEKHKFENLLLIDECYSLDSNCRKENGCMIFKKTLKVVISKPTLKNIVFFVKFNCKRLLKFLKNIK